MPKNTIIDNPVKVDVHMSKASSGHGWDVRPSLTAFSLLKPPPKHIIFLLDTSGSMQNNNRLKNVQSAVSNLLGRLNSQDTFSIVSFDSAAKPLVIGREALPSNIAAAKNIIDGMRAGGGTNFAVAFSALNKREITPLSGYSTVIFLTDGECAATADSLLQPFTDLNIPLRVIPIGVGVNVERTHLNELATKSKGGAAIYITDDNPSAYQCAFDEAFESAMEQSDAPAQIKLTLHANDQQQFATFAVQRDLNRICYDSASPTTVSFLFDSVTPPRSLKLRFDCDNTSLRTDYTLTTDEYSKLEQNQPIDIHIPAFKWKNNSWYSWMMAWAALASGALLLAGVALFALSIPVVSLAMWKPLLLGFLVGLTGFVLCAAGLWAIGRKTIFLPMKSAVVGEEPPEQVMVRHFNPLRVLSRVVPQHLPVRKIVTGLALASFGAGIGYGAAVNAVIATGISAHLFIAGCAIGGAVTLPLLVYGCMQLQKACSRLELSRFVPPLRKIGTGAVLMGSGAAAGYVGGTYAAVASAVIATGISAHLFITGCAIGGAIALPLLVYGCMQLKNACATLLPSRFFPPMPSRSNMVTGGVLTASGAAAGYLSGTFAAAASAVIATGISPHLFIAGCSLGGAIVLPLMVYGGFQLASICTSTSTRLSPT